MSVTAFTWRGRRFVEADGWHTCEVMPGVTVTVGQREAGEFKGQWAAWAACSCCRETSPIAHGKSRALLLSDVFFSARRHVFREHWDDAILDSTGEVRAEFQARAPRHAESAIEAAGEMAEGEVGR